MLIKKIYPETFGEILLKTKFEIYDNFIKNKRHNEHYIIEKFIKKKLFTQTFLYLRNENNIFLEIDFDNLIEMNNSIIKTIIPSQIRPFIIFEKNKIFICHGFYLYQSYKEKYIIILKSSAISDSDPNNIKVFKLKKENFFQQQNELYNLINKIYPKYITSFPPFSERIKDDSGLIKRLIFLKQNF